MRKESAISVDTIQRAVSSLSTTASSIATPTITLATSRPTTWRLKVFEWCGQDCAGHDLMRGKPFLGKAIIEEFMAEGFYFSS